MKRFYSVALIVLFVSLAASMYSVEGRSLLTMTPSGKAVRDFQVGKNLKKAPVRREKDSFRKVPTNSPNPTPASSSRHLSSSSEMAYSASSSSLDPINTKVLTYDGMSMLSVEK
ncbi:PREDICTED: uncharacterized protein LOC109132220 [Camelina sativa]|uniref:Uncharacterized protein LOC109132220 n=1 Tax=Camelina sativa TaxID=90675 RepID=A0ABM1RJ61_CAMSA|nr:PREDICTED: uncharacterized protein LOC109132220 [Camelina sativa]